MSHFETDIACDYGHLAHAPARLPLRGARSRGQDADSLQNANPVSQPLFLLKSTYLARARVGGLDRSHPMGPHGPTTWDLLRGRQ